MIRKNSGKCFRNSILIAAAFAAGTMLASGARAASISDGNSSLTINPSSSSAPLISQWIVDGVDQYGGSPAGSENLLFAVGTGSLSFNAINSLTVTSSSFTDGIASISYDGGNFSVTVKEILTGGNPGSGASGINETITINNTGTLQPAVQGAASPDSVGDQPLTFHLSDSINLNVNETPNNDTLTLSPGAGTNTADQTDPSGAHVNVTFTPTPDTMNTFTPGIDGFNGLGPVTGDTAFSAQYSFTLDAGDSAIISVNENLTGGVTPPPPAIPLPNSASASLATLTGLGLIALAKRAKKAAR
jgi:hypothetical protein